MASLNRFLAVRRVLIWAKRTYYTKVWGMDLDPTCDFSRSVRFDRTFPGGVHVGAETFVAFDAAILTHDLTRGLYLHTRIGRRCFIGARSIILPGITVGDECIVAAGAVVTKDVPPRCVVAGNPAEIIRREIEVGKFGRFLTADATAARLKVVSSYRE
jgi:acetyltransferase-like isoleucine patch superfamily enzyme